MQTALYYPHSTLNNKSLLKSSLLLWDKVNYIAPSKNYTPKYDSSELASAGEIITEAYVPTDQDRESVTKAIESLLDHDPPDGLLATMRATIEDNNSYYVYREKFSEELITKLADRKLINFPVSDPHDFTTHTTLGLILMGVLAKQCAGTQKNLLTDRVAQYESIAKFLTFETGGDWIKNVENANAQRNIEKALVAISLEIIDPRSLSLQQIIDLRKTETSIEGSFRQNYSKMIKDFTTKMSALTDYKDREEMYNEFRHDMRRKAAELEERMRLRKGQVLLSKEMMATIVVGIGGLPGILAAYGTVGQAVVGIGALGSLWLSYRGDRNKILSENPLGYLYKSRNFPNY